MQRPRALGSEGALTVGLRAAPRTAGGARNERTPAPVVGRVGQIAGLARGSVSRSPTQTWRERGAQHRAYLSRGPGATPLVPQLPNVPFELDIPAGTERCCSPLPRCRVSSGPVRSHALAFPCPTPSQKTATGAAASGGVRGGGISCPVLTNCLKNALFDASFLPRRHNFRYI